MRFTSKQVTVMVVAGCAALVLAPTIAVASGVGLVTITDPTHTTQRAHVAGGRLLTTTAGTVAVAGVVANRDLLPATPWSAYNGAADDGHSRAVLVQPTTKAIGLSSLVISNTSAITENVRLRGGIPSAASCDDGTSVSVLTESMNVTVPAHQTVAVPFATPLTIRPLAHGKVCLFAFIEDASSSGGAVTVSGSGLLQ